MSLARHGPYVRLITSRTRSGAIPPPFPPPETKFPYFAVMPFCRVKYSRTIERIYIVVWEDTKAKELNSENKILGTAAGPSEFTTNAGN